MAEIEFALSIFGLPDGVIQVVRFEGEEEIGRPYRFVIDVISRSETLSVEDLVARAATFSLRSAAGERQIHGVIAEFHEGAEAAGGHYSYQFVLVPRLWLLGLSRNSRSFGTDRALDVAGVVGQLLQSPQGLGLSSDDFAFHLMTADKYPARSYWVQYNETDLDFLHRLIEHWGIFYYFEQGPLKERVVFTDNHRLLPRLNPEHHHLPFRRSAGPILGRMAGVQAVRRRLRPIPRSVRLKDYNHQRPELALRLGRDLHHGDFGHHVEYAANFNTPEEGELFARARSDEWQAQREVFEMQSDCIFMSAGWQFSLHDHFRSTWNHEYLPTAVRHAGTQFVAGAFWEGGEPGEIGYRNHISAIRHATPYRSPRRTPRPIMAGVMPAMIDAPDPDHHRA
ncbi:type VI secretion system Vgr family protein, partial [Inquilinus sp. CA228]|uniref:type VI secretion system Vgr family protein n=1 Tax=Inquilinus sp. CA228 TaxID=3455609 RepID=UPI003F8D5DA2